MIWGGLLFVLAELPAAQLAYYGVIMRPGGGPSTPGNYCGFREWRIRRGDATTAVSVLVLWAWIHVHMDRDFCDEF